MKTPKIGRDISNKAIERRLHDYLEPARFDAGSRRIMIVDGMNLAYQARYAYRKLRNGGDPVAVTFGLPSILRGLIKDRNPSKVIIAWDGKRSEHRLNLLPGYKGHRDKDRDNNPEHQHFLKEVKRVRKLLYYMGIPQAHHEDIEGDDMIYMLVNRYSKLANIDIVSSDKDFAQLISNSVQIYNPREKLPFGPWAFIVDWKVELPQFVDYLCLVGDESDDIPGYRGCGEKTAIKFLKKYWSIKQYLEDTKEFPGLVDKEKLRSVWKKNRLLIDLRRFNKKFIDPDEHLTFYKDSKNPIWQDDKFISFCNQYNLKTFKFPAFKEAFNNL